MKCRFCNAKIQQYHKTCPNCGRKEPQPERGAAIAAMRRKAIMYGCVAVIAVLAVAMFIAICAGWDVGESFAWLKPKANDVYRKKSYSVSDKKAMNRREEVIATMDGAELTNGQLQVYYWMQVYEFVSNYGDSASYLGLDFTGDLAKQMSPDGKSTWQQYFLESALQVWQSNQAFALLAEKNQFELTEEDRDYLENLEENLEKTAKDGGYANADEMVWAELGGGCNAEDYAHYLRVYFLAYRYFSHLYDAFDPSEEEIDAYFQEHMKEFSDAGIIQNNEQYVDVRQILVTPRDGSVLPDGRVVYTAAAWDEAKSEADTIMARWEKGEMTEEEFIALVAVYSDDRTSSQNGGLYSNIVKGDMDEAYDAWCFDEARQPGDYELIKTTYGYHIVYFVEAEPIWYSESRDAVREEMGQEMVDGVLADYAMTIDFKKIVLAILKLKV